MTDFTSFFQALWKDKKHKEPFPWQSMLAEEAVKGEWPDIIDLPTASGKTACLDIAVFALAATAGQRRENRMPRRIWFVVDRRIVVDEAYERARAIAVRLSNAQQGPLHDVAQRLLLLGGERPLGVALLRGATWRSDRWARVPAQPTIICSTVDQLGSALLFRSFGHGERTASIYAGLAANDSLILLDEAHCAVPFMQTLEAIKNYRDARWAEKPLNLPFRFAIMSATAPPNEGKRKIFPKASNRAAALKHPALDARRTAHKRAALPKPVKGDSELISAAVERAKSYVEHERRRVAVMVNRVATAESIAAALGEKMQDAADVVLLTGRLRPLDRDTLVERWKGVLKADSTESLDKPVVVVSTQCLEVGADFSFDALVTECASLDALRQRFGRLNRLGDRGDSPAAIFIREQQAKEPKDDKGDPIYGCAIYESWKWLNEICVPVQQKPKLKQERYVDFQILALDEHIAALRAHDEDRFRHLLAPAPDAPVLMPAHIDLLCQTFPRPTPEPDITLFLHGKERRETEARVVLRADLPEPMASHAELTWTDILSLVPPSSPEMLTVPLHRLRRWLAQPSADDSGDVQGAREETDEDGQARQRCPFPFLLWRGPKRSKLTNYVRDIAPDDIVVLRVADLVLRSKEAALQGLAQTIDQPNGLGPGGLDLAECATETARRRAVVRLHPELFSGFSQTSVLTELLKLATSEEVQKLATSEEVREQLVDAIGAVIGEAEGSSQTEVLPHWIKRNMGAFLTQRWRIETYPDETGVILVGPHLADQSETEDDLYADEQDLTSEAQAEVTWEQHTTLVREEAAGLARHCLADFAATFAAAATAHDLGKLDRRFQLMLRHGDELAVTVDEPLAKSVAVPKGRMRRNYHYGLPDRFRHEAVSLQLAERLELTFDDLTTCGADEDMRELALHLIASHHGHARPFLPVVADTDLQDGRDDLRMPASAGNVMFTAAARRQWIPAHRLDSGVPDRFWRATRRYGWWGLAYLEAIFRLSDWAASARPANGTRTAALRLLPSETRASAQHLLRLDALDGANPLAFLAALGTLRVLSRVFPEHDLRLSWEQRFGAWRPLLLAAKPLDKNSMLAALRENGVKLDIMFSRELLDNSLDLRFHPTVYRQFCAEACAAGRQAHVRLEYAAAWASEMEDPRVTSVVRKTAFHFTSGNQKFVAMLRDLREQCTDSDLARTLFEGWRYTTTAPSLRWDPYDEKRQYALQAIDPQNGSKNPPRADLGANFLAVEALPLFPIVPDRWGSQPGLFRDNNDRRWHWPIWTYPIGLDAIRSLLALPLVDKQPINEDTNVWKSEEWSPSLRRALGIATIFQSAIVKPSGRYRCFTPARSL